MVGGDSSAGETHVGALKKGWEWIQPNFVNAFMTMGAIQAAPSILAGVLFLIPVIGLIIGGILAMLSVPVLILVAPLGYFALGYVLCKQYIGEPVTWKDAFGIVRKNNLMKVWLNSFVVNLVGSVTIYIMGAYALPVMLVERKRMLDVNKRVLELTKGDFGRIIVMLVLAMIVPSVVANILLRVLGVVPFVGLGLGTIASALVSGAAITVLQASYTKLYFDLRAAEGVDIHAEIKAAMAELEAGGFDTDAPVGGPGMQQPQPGMAPQPGPGMQPGQPGPGMQPQPGMQPGMQPQPGQPQPGMPQQPGPGGYQPPPQ